MAGIAITEAELLDALAAATTGEGPEDARTVQEIVAETGVCVGRVRKALKALQAVGRLRVHQVKRTDLSGRVQTIAAYTVEAAQPVGDLDGIAVPCGPLAA